MQSTARTVDEYLAELPDDRRQVISAVRKVILDNLDSKYEEGMQYGMIGYYVPHSIFPAGYHCDPRQPLPFVNLASQKNHMALYMMCLYGDEKMRAWFESRWVAAGKKLDMGKSCVRFKKIDDLALDVLAEAIRKVPAKKYIQFFEEALKKAAKPSASGKASKLTLKKVTKKAAAKGRKGRDSSIN